MRIKEIYSDSESEDGTVVMTGVSGALLLRRRPPKRSRELRR